MREGRVVGHVGKLGIIVGVALICGAALADSGSVHETVSKCFHPFSDFVSGTWLGDAYSIGEHTVARDGVLKYRPLNNHVYTMRYVFQVREVDGDKMYRVIPDDETDTGPMGPDSSCRQRQWQSVN
jgi:hypothetical protein